MDRFISLGRDEPLVTPNMFTKERSVPDKGLIIFTDVMLKAVRKKVGDIREFRWIPGHTAFTCSYNDREIFVLKPYFGAPATTIALELAVAAGGRKIVGYGEAGALSEELRIGDYVVPTWGVREEGTSYHYMPPEYIPKPNMEIVNVILENADEAINGDRRIIKGGIWSTDAIFRETRDKVRAMKDKGAVCVDMEATALMTVAHYRGIEFGMLIVISDELYHEEWRTGWGSKELEYYEEKGVDIVLNTLASL